MEHVRIGDLNYFDLHDDSESDDGNESSDDEIEMMLHGTPEQRCTLYQKNSASSESDDEFENEMNKELDEKVKEMEEDRQEGERQISLEATSGFGQTTGSDDEGATFGSHLSNNDLFYDPDMDDCDQRWMDSQRKSHRDKLSSGKNCAAPKSDAILDCPACLTTVCIDCQRHSLYQNQYRAMFVMNCTVDRSETLKYPEVTRKRGKTAKSCTVTKVSKLTSDGTSNQATSVESGDVWSLKSDGIESTESVTLDTARGVSYLTSDSSTSSMPQSGDQTLGGLAVPDPDDFYQVKCSECNTGIGVIDSEEVYHFYNVIAAYT